jgi:hypothetical protein
VIQGSTSATNKTVTITVPTGAVSTATTFALAPGGVAAEVSDGYLVVKVTATAGTTPVTTFAAPIQITLPAGALDGVAAWSTDGNIWFPLTRLSTLALPAGISDGYFINADGTVTILTNHFSLFGWRKAQSPLSITSSATVIQLDKSATLAIAGGSGSGALKYATGTATQCSVSDAGVVTAKAAGSCSITVTKYGSSFYLSAASTITLTISDSDARAAAEAKAKAEAEAKAKAEAEAKAKAEAEAKAKAEAEAAAAAAKTLIKVGVRANGRTPISVNLASSFKGKRANLFVNGTYVGFMTLNKSGNATWQITRVIKKGDSIRVSVGGKTEARRTV